jgi:hypothetical protein
MLVDCNPEAGLADIRRSKCERGLAPDEGVSVDASATKESLELDFSEYLKKGKAKKSGVPGQMGTSSTLDYQA